MKLFSYLYKVVFVILFLFVMNVFFLYCNSVTVNPIASDFRVTNAFISDSVPMVTFINQSNFPNPGFNRYPLLAKSYENNIFIRKAEDSGHISVSLDEKRELFYSGDTFIPYILDSNDSIVIQSNLSRERKFPYILTSNNEKRRNEVIFFQEAVLNGIPILFWERGNQIKGLINIDSVTNNLPALKELYQKTKDFCSNYFGKNAIEQSFSKFVKDYIKFDYYNKIFLYIDRSTIIDSLIEENYFDFSIDNTNPFYNCNYAFQGALYQYALYKQKHLASRTNIVTLFKIADISFAPSSASLFKYGYLKNHFGTLYLNSPEKLSAYIGDVNDKNYRFILEDKLGELDFASKFKNKIIDKEGKELTLTDIVADSKGKVVYIDFWASWCSPCRKEFSYYRELKQILKDAPVDFLFVSIDRSKESWQKAYQQEKIDSIRNNYLFVNPGAEVLKKLNLDAIPRYYLFDKSGKLVTNDAPRPSDPELIPLIKKLMAKGD